jgi:protein arginine N-methyltransferase 1
MFEAELHGMLLADRTRMRAFKRAIFAVVRPGDRVLDIGTGTGILALWAARAGAGRVIGVDKDPVASLAKRIVAANKLESRITILKGKSQEVSIRPRCDVLITETIGDFGLSEDILGVIGDAKKRLLKPGARLVPAELSLFLAPAGSDSLARQVGFWRRVHGFDFIHAQDIARNLPIWTGEAPTLLAAPARSVSFDFGGPAPMEYPVKCSASFRCSRPGKLDGFYGWFEAALAPAVRMSSRSGTHWRNCFLPVVPGFAVRKGDMLDFGMTVTRCMTFSWTVEVRRAGSAVFGASRSSLLAHEDINERFGR